MPDNGSLDTQIRDLVASAVADAPHPPELDPDALPDVDAELDHGHRRWWIGGGAALLAAAAAITTLLLVNGTDQSVRTPPATDPSIVVAPAPPTSAPGPTTTTTQVVTSLFPVARTLAAGPYGVVVHVRDDARVLTTEPMAIALDAGDGRVIVQREAGDGTSLGWTEADTVPQVLAADGSLSELFGTADWDGAVVFHDVEVVDGHRLLLFSLQVAMNTPEANETLYVVDLDSGERTEVAPGIGGDGFGTGRLHLATSGLVVGEARPGGSAVGTAIYAVPGSPAARAAMPTSTDLGLDETDADCEDCPRAFTVSPDGVFIAWIEGDVIVVDRLDESGDPERIDLPARPPCCGGLDVIVEDGSRTFLVSVPYHQSGAPADRTSAFVITPDTAMQSFDSATTATAGPVGVAEPAPTTTTTSTTVAPTTVPPTVSDAAAILTAGPDGVVERRDGEPRTLTSEPMAIALDAGDGRIIVQRHAGNGSVNGGDWTDAETAPLVLAPDGTLTELFGTADWDGGVVLHDVEVVAGRRLLLFSLQGPQVPQEPSEDLYVVDLDTQDRTLVAEAIGGWEFGTDRLHLARTGLIVGEASGEAFHWIEIQAVPGSPAAAAAVPTPAAFGLEDSYSDCTDCPQTFSVAPDGETVAWIDGATNQLMRVPVAGGTAEPLVEVPAERFADLDYNDDGAVLSWFQFVSAGETPAPIEVPFDGSGPSELDGTAATFGPAGADGTEPPPSTAPAELEPTCGVDPQAGAITDAIGEVPPAFDGFPGWVYGGDSNFDPCAALSYARLDTQLGTASSPMQVMLFHQGTYIGTATECPLSYTTVTDTSEDSLTVEYRWPQGDDPNATPSGLATVTFRWDGNAVQMAGELPSVLLDATGCAG